MQIQNEKLQELIEKVVQLKDSQEIKALLECMSFFALIKLLDTYFETQDIVSDTLTSFAGSIFNKLNEMFEPRDSRNKANNKITAILLGT
jgi:hypothetical protein